MVDPELTRLYGLVLLSATALSGVAVLLLGAVRLLAVNGIRVMPDDVQRVSGGLSLGLPAGLLTVTLPTVWIVPVALLAAVGWWLLRAGRRPDVGTILIGGSLPWLAVYAWSLGALPGDPTRGPVDYRLLVAAAALVVMALGVALVVIGPAAPRPPRRTWAHRVGAVGRAIERAQALGPLPAPAVMGFASAVVASIATYLLARGIDPPLRSVVAIVPAIVLATVWLGTTPSRVRHAYEVFGWLAAVDRRRVGLRGGRLPFTTSGWRRLIDGPTESDEQRAFHVALLIAFDRFDEAHAELERLPVDTDWQRFTVADLRQYLAWSTGESDPRTLHELDAAAAAVPEGGQRLQARGSVALARMRIASEADDPDAVDHLAALRDEVGERARPYRHAHRRPALIAALLWGLVGLVSSVLRPIVGG